MLHGDGGEPAAGSGDAQRSSSILQRAAALRFPSLRDLPPRDRVEALVDHIQDTAIARGELEELRLEAQANLHELRQRFNKLPAPSNRSKAGADEARRALDPVLAERIDGARWLVERCTEGIMRMGGSEYDAASRTYTLLSGS